VRNNKKVVRVIDRIGVTYNDAIDAYLASVTWRRLDESKPGWIERADFYVLDKDDIIPFSEDYSMIQLKIAAKLKEQLR